MDMALDSDKNLDDLSKLPLKIDERDGLRQVQSQTL